MNISKKIFIVNSRESLKLSEDLINKFHSKKCEHSLSFEY